MYNRLYLRRLFFLYCKISFAYTVSFLIIYVYFCSKSDTELSVGLTGSTCSALLSVWDFKLLAILSKNSGSAAPMSDMFSRILIISLQISHTATRDATAYPKLRVMPELRLIQYLKERLLMILFIKTPVSRLSCQDRRRRLKRNTHIAILRPVHS